MCKQLNTYIRMLAWVGSWIDGPAVQVSQARTSA